jgi:hypothetical protein
MEALVNSDLPGRFRFGVMSVFVSAGATIGDGAGAAVMRNQNGVVMNLVTTTRGLDLDLGLNGVKIELKN